MFGGLKTKQQHNINCIEAILGLNIPQVTAAVHKAVNKHNIFDGANRPTNADLLYIVFECLNSYLENLNLQETKANEQSLIERINQIGQILEIVNVGKYLQYVDYRFRISNVIARNESDKMVSLTLSGVYVETEKIFKKQEKHMYPKMLELITSVTRVTNQTPENALTPNQLRLWFQDVIPLIFEQKKDIQISALKAVEVVLPFIQLSSYQEHPNWPALEKRITSEYLDIVAALREKGDSLWYKMWNVLVKLLNEKLLKVVVNNFLTICEHGFKSSNLTTRAETFICWKVLLDIYSQNPKYLSSKRIKLLLIPFKTVAKTPDIAVNKFLVWWSLICKVESKIDQYYDSTVVPFLWFAFGLSEKPILSKDEDIGIRQEVYPILTTLSVSALISLLGPVKEATRSLCKIPIEYIRAPYSLPSLLENVGRFLINSCGEATFLLKDVDLVDAYAACDNMWSNLMIHMNKNKDPTLTELILQNLAILKNESQNDEAAKKLVTLAATIALSSENLIPNNLIENIALNIQKRIENLLTDEAFQFNENELKRIINNCFKLSPEAKQLKSQLQQILLFLRDLSSSVRVSGILWSKVVNHITQNFTASVATLKEIFYGYVKWVVDNSTVTLLPALLSSWINLARLLLNNDSDGVFWLRINEILRAAVDGSGTRIFEFIAALFEIIKPEGAFPNQFKTLVEAIVKSTPSSLATELLPIADGIFKISEQIKGNYSSATHRSLNELMVIIEAKFDISVRVQFSVFEKFHKKFEKYVVNVGKHNSAKTSSKAKDDEFVFIPSTWQFRPDTLTEHQKEKFKEKRVDIPALYNDMSQSQDSHSISLKPWTPKAQLQPNVEQPSSQVVECDETKEEKQSSNKTKILQLAPDQVAINNLQTWQPYSDSMPSTSLESLDDNGNTSNIVNEPTPNKVENEERRQKRKQLELKKLQLSIANPDQYLLQGRTRRMSISLKPPGQSLRKRSHTTTSQNRTPSKLSRRTKNTLATSTDSAESDASEIIEASQTLATPSRRTRQSRNVLGTTSTTKTPDKEKPVKEKSSEKDESSESREEENILLNISVDNTSIDEQTVSENDSVEKTEISASDSKQPPMIQDDFTHSTTVATTENNSNTEILQKKSDEVAVPEANDNHITIEDAHSEVSEVNALAPQVTPVSPVRKLSQEDSLSVSGILASPTSNESCSKTTELLNSTVNISPILHPKPVPSDQQAESNCKQPSSAETSNEKIDADQIKRTELDNLIKVPIDSPILHPRKKFHSTPPSQNTKRRFQLEGRGAKLLQIMNQRKLEEASLLNAKMAVQTNGTTPTPRETTPANKTNMRSYEEILATNKDLFRFSKVLPSPQASPSTSIMKRSFSDITDMDDIDSSNQKRKRVSFHDPPVSLTKEFIRFAEEINPNRLRINRHSSSPLNMRNILTRKCRAESLNEINKFTLSTDEASMQLLHFNDASDDEEIAAASMSFPRKDEVLQHVCEQYPLEDVLERYFASGYTLREPTSKIFANQLIDLLKTDETKRNIFLEDLSDKFPNEYLNVAVQENLASTVTQRLSPMDMLNCIADRAKTDNDLKHHMIEKFSTVIAEPAVAQTEMKDDLYKLLLDIISHKMSNKQLLEVLDVIFEKRRTSSCS